MAGAEENDKLDKELYIQNEKLRKIKTYNGMFDSLVTAKKNLCDLEKQWFFQRWFSGGARQELKNKIGSLEKQTENQQRKTEQENELKGRIKTLEIAKTKRMENVLWKGLPERLNKDVQEKYLQKFKTLPQRVDEEVECVNITMFGGIGVGKSSFLNTLVTALMNNPNTVYTDYKTAPFSFGKSKTKTFQLDKFKVDGMKELPIRFYDCPGIDEEEDRTMTLDVLEAVIKGHVKPDSKFNSEKIMNKEGDSYRPDPSLQDSIHCIAFVIKATALLNDPRDLALRKIKALQKRMNGPRDVHQVVIVTNMDKIGIPDVDLESLFKYNMVKDMYMNVSKCLGIENRFIYPVANYENEMEPDAAKNALALMALWDMFERGERLIQKKLENE